jgi:hypothetical protein
MGHDIEAFLGQADPEEPFEYLDGWSNQPEIAYLRRGAYNPLRHELYEALEAQEYDGDVSGVWAARWFNRDQLQAALERLQKRKRQGLEVDPEIQFIKTCFAAMPPERCSIFITFG